jgi:hypothetical protein
MVSQAAITAERPPCELAGKFVVKLLPTFSNVGPEPKEFCVQTLLSSELDRPAKEFVPRHIAVRNQRDSRVSRFINSF